MRHQPDFVRALEALSPPRVHRHRGSLRGVRVLCRSPFGAIVAPREKFPEWS
jgi:hypothetical protein